MKKTVEMDYLSALQMISAGQERILHFEQAIRSGGALPTDVLYAIHDTSRAIRAIRAAFEVEIEAEKCCGSGGSTPHWVHCPSRSA